MAGLAGPIDAQIGIVVVGHGERGKDYSNAILLGHARTVGEALPGVPVAGGVLSGLPHLEGALAKVANEGARRILVYPYFMAAGFFVGTKIPKRIAEAGFGGRCTVLAPLGADPGLPSLIMRKAVAVAEDELKHPAGQCRLLLAGHGSKVSRASAEATEAVAAALRSIGGFAHVATAYLEEAPFLDDVIVAEDTPTVIVGFFNGDGLHAGEDVPEAMESAKGPVAYTGAIGAMPEVAGLIANAIETAVCEMQAKLHRAV
ncbi:MAG: sirohydrochlorin chelatase [Hyphomicrobiaceae bacterium]